MTTRIREAAESYVLSESKERFPHRFNEMDMEDCWIAGSSWMLEEVLKDLRSEDAYAFRETHAKRLKQCWLNTEMADWIENRFKGEK